MLRNVMAVISVLMLSTSYFAQQKAQTLEDLRWLSGCWELTVAAKHELLTEQWMKPAGGMMLGVGRTVRNNKAVDFEFMRIEQKNAGIFFIARPRSNSEETPFKLITLGANKVVFENKEHDFPQRVIYRRRGITLTGRIEGTNNGKVVAIDYPMKRTNCN